MILRPRVVIAAIVLIFAAAANANPHLLTPTLEGIAAALWVLEACITIVVAAAVCTGVIPYLFFMATKPQMARDQYWWIATIYLLACASLLLVTAENTSVPSVSPLATLVVLFTAAFVCDTLVLFIQRQEQYFYIKAAAAAAFLLWAALALLGVNLFDAVEYVGRPLYTFFFVLAIYLYHSAKKSGFTIVNDFRQLLVDYLPLIVGSAVLDVTATVLSPFFMAAAHANEYYALSSARAVFLIVFLYALYASYLTFYRIALAERVRQPVRWNQ